MNNDIYNNKSGSSLQDAYARLNEAIKIRDASAKGQQYDNVNGVALNTTPIVNNASQGQQVQQQATPVTDDNIAIRTAGTVEQALRNIKSGFLNLGEGVIDAHIALAGIVNKEWAEEAIKFDISDTITEWMDNNLSANALYKSKTGNNLYDQSWLNDADEKIQNIVMGVEQGIGNALGFMALSSVPYVGVALTWEGSSGMALEEAINDPYYNGDYYGAAGSAILKGGVETGLEYLMGWSPKKMGVSTKTFKTVVKELGKNFAEEGLEEVASDLITPLFDGMYTDKTLAESYDKVTLESLGETFLVGGLTGALMTGAGEVASAAYLSPEGQRIAHDIKENEEYYQQAYEKFKNNPNEEQALEEFNEVKEKVYNNLMSLGQRITKLNSKYQNRLGNGIIIDGHKFSLSDKVAMDALKIGDTDPRKKAIIETIDLINESGISELADYTIEFTTDPNINGSFDSTNKKITINLNTQKAAKFILGHEITHAFENNTAYKKVYDEIVASLKEDGTYEELYNKAKKLYKKQIKGKTEAAARKYLEEEIVADYMGNNFKNFAEIQKLFTKQSTWEKFKDMIKGIRKENRSSKAKEYYQRFLKESYGTKVEEKKQPKPALAGIKYSMADYKGGSQIFDELDTGTPYYNGFLEDKNYKNDENLKGTVVKMTPNEYYDMVVEHVFHGISAEDLKKLRKQRLDDRSYKNIDEYWEAMNNVLTENKKMFDLPYINLAHPAQEGLHRMMLAGELHGWDVPQNCLVVDWLDKEKHNRDVQKKQREESGRIIYKALKRLRGFTFDSKQELMDSIRHWIQVRSYNANAQVLFKWDKPHYDKELEMFVNNKVTIIYEGATQTIKPDIDWKQHKKSLLDLESEDVIPFDEFEDFLFEDDDLRFSISEEYSDEYDTEEEPLTAQQSEFFKDSKIREDGNLMVMYHGTNNGGFMEFNSESGVYFFTPDYEVATTYADEVEYPKIVNTRKFNSADELIDWWYEEGFESFNGTYDIMEAKKAKDQVKKYVEERLRALKYRNAPQQLIDNEKVENYKYIILNEDGDWVGVYASEESLISNALDDIRLEDGFEYDYFMQEYTERKSKEAIYKVYVNVTNPLIINCRGNDFMHVPFRGQRMTTDDIAVMVKEEGRFDGIIFKNIMDNGASDLFNSLGTSDVYVAFEPNQIKATDNLNPTDNPDIRYSKVDTGNEIANTSKQIQKEVQKAHDFVKENKQYQEDPIKALKQQVDSEIQNINHTKKGGKDISKDARSVLVNFRGDKFLQNKFIADTITPDQKNYLETIFSFLEERINKLNYSKRKTIPVLDYETKIDNMDGYEEYHEVFEGKTEGDLVLSALRVINKILNNANNNTVKLNGKELNRKTATQEEVERQRNYGRTEQKSAKGILKLIKQAGSSVLDGASYFDILANCDDKSLLNEIYLELYNSYLNKLKVAREYQEDINKFIKDKSNKKFLKKLKDEKSRVEIGGVKVLYGEAISLYMALDAKNAPEHLLKADRGGTVITNEKGQRSTIEQKAFRAMLQSTEKGAELLKQLDAVDENSKAKTKPYLVKGKERKDLYKECGKIIKAEIGKVIENDASELIRILRKYYDKSGTLYQQTAQEHNGFSFPVQEEGTYYPLKTDLASFNKQSGTLDTTGNFMNDTMNPSFTKSLSGNVSNAIQISDVLETYVHFSEQLATWSQISVKIKQIDRFLNTTVSIPNQQRGIKFREYINQYIDPDFTKRYESLVKSMQGINRTEKTTVDRILNKTRGINASVSLAFNAKTIAIQPTAYFKFWHYVSPKNWLKAFGSNKGLKDFKWLVEHSALVYDRYFGNQGQNVAEAQTVGAASSLNAIGKAGMWGITQTDKLPLMLGWKAVQLEAQEKGITDETEILSMFEKAMYETQATHDALSNGSAVRVDNEIAKSFLMFSSENRKTLSRFFHSLYALKVNPKSKKAWREFSASTTSMVASAAFIAAISSILKRLKGDDEDEFIEMYGKEFGANMVGVFPVISNLYNNIVNGYDLQLTGFSQITDLQDLPQYCETLMSTNASESAKTSAIMQIAQRIAHVVGIPFRNIYNDIMYIAGLGDFAFNTDMVLKLRNLYYNTNNSSLTTLAKTYSKRGDKDKVSAVIQIKSKNYGAGEISDKVSNEFARLYMNGSMESFPTQLQDEYTVEGTLVKMNKEEYKHAQSVYELANEQMELMMATSQYLGLTDEEKAIAIKKLYSAYYDVAKSDTIGVEGTKFSKVSKYIDTGKYASYLAKIQSMKANTLTNKKEAVQAYVNRTNLSKAEKYLLAYLAGYSIADDGKTQVAAYLRSKGMSYKDSKTFTGIK